VTHDPIQTARSIQSTAGAREHYRKWAQTYDRDVFDHAGVTGTDTIADLLAQHVDDRTASVIDLGCGTGAAGRRLQSHGFTTIDGVDLSPEMLAIAATTGAYRNLAEIDLNVDFQLLDARYDASICAGTFIDGHVGAEAIQRVATFLRPGATVAWVIAESLWPRFEVAVTEAAFDVIHQAIEPVRRGAKPEAIMLVARLRSAY
jgi:predicted TPR repeat methyltransferase